LEEAEQVEDIPQVHLVVAVVEQVEFYLFQKVYFLQQHMLL
jgi:hypothetical protein